MKQTWKRIGSILLALCMVLTLLPALTLPAWAAVEGAKGDMTALDALGIDSSVAPEGYDANTTDNPYGRNNTTIADVDELFVIGGNMIGGGDPKSGKLYGHDIKLGGTVSNFLTSTPKVKGPTQRILSLEGQALVEGNFSTDNKGQRKQVAYVGLRRGAHPKLSMNIFFGALNPLTSSVDESSAWQTQYYSKSGGYGNLHDLVKQSDGGFSFKNEYLATEYSKIAAGDFDGDGIDEIAVYIPERDKNDIIGKARIEVWKLQEQGGNSYETFGNWKLAMSYPLKQYKANKAVAGNDDSLKIEVGDTLVPNMVSLTANDFNKDGVDDLAVSWGYFGPALEGVQESYATMLFGGRNGGMLAKRTSIDLTAGNDKIYRASFTSGDVDGDGQDELVLGGSLESKTSNSRYVAIYEWDGTKFNVSQAKNFDLFEKDVNGNRIHRAVVRNEEKYYSLPLAPANIAVGRFNGLASPMNIYLDSIVISMGDNGMEISRMLDYQMRTEAPNDYYYYAEWGVRTADFIGSGTESFVTAKADIVIQGGWDPKKPGELLRAISSNILSATNFINVIYVENNNLQIRGLLAENEKKGSAFCLPNTDNDTTQLSYTGKHYFTYSDPKILAVLASPPYFTDLDNDELSGQMMWSTTGYGKIKGSGSGSMYSNTLSVGLYTTWEKDFGIFGITLFSAEAEIAINNSMTWETVEISSLEQNVEYESLSGQDTVVFFAVPVETYVYEAKTPVIVNGVPTGYETQTMTVNIPHEANIKNLPVETYNRIAADYDGLPKIDDSVLSHTIGVPFSYPRTTAGFGSNTKSLPKLVSSGNPSSVGVGASSQSKEIVMTQETEKSFTYELEIDTRFGVGGGGVMAGITAGYGHGAGSISVTTSGNSFTSTMQSLPNESEPYGYDFNWKLFAYPYDNGHNVFPVITYLVSDVVQPPLLPVSFEQIEDGSGDTQIALTWQHSGNPQSFVVYRYFQFTSAAGYYPVSTINAGDIANIIKTEGNTRIYRYIDKNLSPNTEYKYRIQTIGNGKPDTSIQSATLSAYTAPSGVNMPTVSLNKENLIVYPDTPGTVTATVGNMTSGGTKNFMWQKENKDGTWKDLGVTSDTLRIIDAGLDDAGVYRCKVAIFIDQNLVSAYSPKIVVEYQKREAELYDLTVNGNKVSVIATGKDTRSIPSGVITFTLSASGYTKEYTVSLNTAGKAEISLSAVNGVYKVSAAYGGNRIFRTSAIDKDNNGESVFFTAGTHTGVLYDYSKNYTYGDDLNIIKYTFTADGKVDAKLVDYSQLDVTTVSIQLLKPTKTSIDNNDKIEYELTSGTNVLITLQGLRGDYIGLDEDTLLERFKTGKAGWVGDVLLKIDEQDILFHVNPAPVTIAFKQGDSNYSVPDMLSKNELKESLDGNDGGRLYDFTPAKSLEVIGQTKFGDDLLPSANSTPLSSDFYGLRFMLHDSVNNLVKGWEWKFNKWNQSYHYNTLAPGVYTVSMGMFTHTEKSQVIPWLCYNITSGSKILLITGDAYEVWYGAANDNSTGNTVGKVELVKPIDGRSMYPVGTELVFVATPYDGYEINVWLLNGVPVPNNTTNRLTLTQTAAGSRVIATFKAKQNTMAYSALPENPTVAGESVKNTITGSVKSGNVVTAGAPMTFTAQAASGWHFVGWECFIEGGQTQYGSNASYTMTMPNSSVRLFAKFERDGYQLTLGEGLTATDASGKILDTSKPITGDTEITVKPGAGMVVAAGAIWTVDDVETTFTGDAEYTFTLKKDTKVSLPVSMGTYRVNATADNGDYGTVSVAVAGVTNPDLNNIVGGTRITVTATAKRGYILDEWIVDGNTVSKNSAYTFTLSKDTEVTAAFVERMDFRNLEVIKGLYDEVDVTVNDDVLKTESPEKIYPGEHVTITATPKPGYMVNGWSRNGVFSQIYSNTLIVSYDELSGVTTTISPQFVAISTGKLNFTIESVKTDDEYTATLTVKDASGRTIADNGNMVNQSALTFTASFEAQSSKNIITTPSGITTRLVTEWTVTYTGDEEETVLNEAGKPFMGNVLTLPGLVGSATVKAYYENCHELEGCEVTTDSDIGIAIAEPVFTRSEDDSGEITYEVKSNFAILGTAVTFTVPKIDSLGAVKVDGSTGSGFVVDDITFAGFDRVEKLSNDYICTIWVISGDVNISTTEKGTEPPQGTKPTISTGTLPNGTVGIAYSQTFGASGDTPITWSVKTGTLPDGLTLTGDTISGTPTMAGIYSFTVQASNSAGTDDKTLTISVAEEATTEKDAQTIIFTDSTQTRTYGDAPFTMKATLQGAGGTGEITYASNNESVATIDPATGEVTIVGVGLATITATKAEDANYAKATASYSLTVTNLATYTITASTGANGTITPSGAVTVAKGSSKTFTITANAGYSISSVTVDGMNHGAINTYTFSNVTGNHTITALFTSNSGGTGGGSSTPSTGIAVKDLADGKKSDVTVNSNAGTVILPSDMLNNLDAPKDANAEVKMITVHPSNLTAEAQALIGNRPIVSINLLINGKVTDWNNPDAPVTVSIPYGPTGAELANPEGITAYYIDSAGNLTEMVGAKYDPAAKAVVFQTTHFSYYAVGYKATATPTAPNVQFSDVLPNAWYYEAVRFCAEKGITSGTSATTFSPDATLTRGQFITMLLKAYGIAPVVTPTDNFTDAGNTYYTGYLAAAKAKSISNGVGNNNFAPEKAITRQEMFTLLYNALKVLDKLPTADNGKSLADFTDSGSVASWATDAMSTLVKSGTVSGSGGKLDPTGSSTRAQMAQVLYNLLEK